MANKTPKVKQTRNRKPFAEQTFQGPKVIAALKGAADALKIDADDLLKAFEDAHRSTRKTRTTQTLREQFADKPEVLAVIKAFPQHGDPVKVARACGLKDGSGMSVIFRAVKEGLLTLVS